MRQICAVSEAEQTEDREAELAVAVAVPQQFEVHDHPTAEWLVRKVVEANGHIARVKDQAEREIRRTQRERDFLLMRYGPQLERWTKAELQKHKGRRKSVLLLSGTVGFRATGAKLVVDNQSAVLQWAKRCCRSAVVTVQRLSRSELTRYFAATGELPEGAHLQPAGEKFYLK
jgi:hypothetical protein